MRAIEAGSRFKKDFGHWIKGTPLEDEFAELLRLLASGAALPAHYRDHPLRGNWRNCRDCHLRSDVVVIYVRTARAILLIRIGSHAALFGG